MLNLTNPSTLRHLLTRHGCYADKQFGQNFLIDARVLADTLDAAEIHVEDTVFEVGPGLGVLTRELSRCAQAVRSIELDKRFQPVLAETLAGCDNVTLYWQDALTFDFTYAPPGSLLVANLPYNVATAVVMRVLESLRFKRLVFLVQREVGQRMCARTGDAGFGALSLMIEHYARAKVVRHVKPGSFLPPPEVVSSLVQLTPYPNTHHDLRTFALIRIGFKHRRKTFQKNLLLAGMAKPEVQYVFEAFALDRQTRAEQLSLAQFRALSQAFSHIPGIAQPND